VTLKDEVLEKLVQLDTKEKLKGALVEHKEDLEKSFNDIIDKEINRIGESMQSAQSNPQDTSRLRDLSLDDFMKDNDKIIKDK